MADDLKRVGAAWRKQGRKGEFLSIALSESLPADSRLFAFANNKRTSRDPDYGLFLAPPDEGASRQPPRERRQESSRRPSGAYPRETLASFVPDPPGPPAAEETPF